MRCEEMGIMIDLAHLNERGFWDVKEIYDGPLVSTHTAAHGIAPSPRNLTDNQISAVAETDGVIGITFHVGDIREDGELNRETSMSTLVDHFEYIADKVGVEHVAFGSDFEGGTMPECVDKTSKVPRIIEALKNRGYSDRDIEKIAYKNWIRVLDQVW
jgi:membrane dipeptidase